MAWKIIPPKTNPPKQTPKKGNEKNSNPIPNPKKTKK